MKTSGLKNVYVIFMISSFNGCFSNTNKPVLVLSEERYVIFSYALLCLPNSQNFFAHFFQLLFKKTLLRYNWHSINVTYFKCTIQWFLVKLELCNCKPPPLCQPPVIALHLDQRVYCLRPHFLTGCFQAAAKIETVGKTRVSRLWANFFPMRIVHRLQCRETVASVLSALRPPTPF